MAGNDNETKHGVGGAVLGLGAIVAVVTLGFNVLVFLLNEQGKQEDKLDQIQLRKADKDDLNRKVGDRWTATMQRLHEECTASKEDIKNTSEAHARDAVKWEVKYHQCQETWELHKMLCKCNHEDIMRE